MSLEVTETDKGYEVKFNYDPIKVAAIKTIKNAWFRSGDKTWIVPKHREREMNMFKDKFGLMTEPVVQMPEEVGAMPVMPELTVQLNLVREPFHFQASGIARGMQLKRFINGDQPGLGKTTQAIGTAIALQAKCILVICPNSLKYNWKNEWMIVAGRKSMELTNSNRSSWQTYYKVGMINVFICNYESLKKFFVKPGWKKPPGKFKMSDIEFMDSINLFDCVIVDESHSIKDPTAMQSRFTRGICSGKPIIQLLTGTPLINKPRDIAHQLMAIDRLRDIIAHIPQPKDKDGKLTDWNGWTRFMNRYCDGGNGSSCLKELNYRLNQICFFRREKKEVLKDLPEKIRQVVECEITNREEYVKCEDEFINYLKEVKGCDDKQVQKKLAGEVLVKMNLLRQIAGRGKIQAAKDYIDQIVDSGEKIVVFREHREITHALKEIYPDGLTISGEDSKEDREANIKMFQNRPDKNKIFCSLKAGGVGITLTTSPYVLLVQTPYTDALIEQAIDRTHRIGQKENVIATILLGKDTIDQYIYYEIIMKKRDLHIQVTGSSDRAIDEVVDGLLNFFSRRA